MREGKPTRRRVRGPLKADEVDQIVSKIFKTLRSLDDAELKNALSTGETGEAATSLPQGQTRGDPTVNANATEP